MSRLEIRRGLALGGVFVVCLLAGARLAAAGDIPVRLVGGVGYGESAEEEAPVEADSLPAAPTGAPVPAPVTAPAPVPAPAPTTAPAPVAAGAASVADGGKPSRTRMILLSALVPGWGQLDAGQKTWGTVFLMGEVASWTSLIAFETQGSQREDRFIEHAERFAGVESPEGQPDSYYASLAEYDHSGLPGGPDSYNDVEVRYEARNLYPNDPESQAAYIAANEITGDLAWDWESDDRRFEFADLRIASETAYHRANYAIAGLVAGRILSVLHAVWSTAEPEEGVEGAALGAAPAWTPLVESDFARGRSRLGLCYRF